MRFAPPLAFACLLACLATAPAWAADTAPGEPAPVVSPAPGSPIAPPPADEPALGLIVLPLPLVTVAGGFTYENFRLGATRHEVRLLAGYYWSRNYYFDPLGQAPQALKLPDGTDFVVSNTWQIRGAWGWRLAPWATLYLDGWGVAGGPAATGGYDDPLAGGASLSGGPLLQLSSLDAPGFPTTGWLLRAGVASGQHWGASTFAFQRGMVDLMRFIPIGPHGTVALRAVGQLAGPQLAWVDKFNAGGGTFVRGFPWNRFTGDRLAAATVEYRHLIEADLLGRLGLALGPLNVGVASATFVDAGRAWEGRSGLGVAFPSDVRVGGGTGVIALVNGVPAGRIELNASAEGIYPMVSGGASFSEVS